MCRDQGDLILTCGADDHEQLADDWKVVHSAHFLGHASGVIAKDLADGYEAERETSDSSWLRSAVTE